MQQWYQYLLGVGIMMMAGMLKRDWEMRTQEEDSKAAERWSHSS